MGINCAPLVADLFLFCYERDTNRSDAVYTFNSISIYLANSLNIDDPCIKQNAKTVIVVSKMHSNEAILCFL